MKTLALRLDATEGQIWSLAIGLVLAVGLALAGLPPVVHHAREPRVAAATGAPEHAAPSAAALTPVTQAAVAVPTAGDVTVTVPSATRTSRSRTSSSVASSTEASSAEPFGSIMQFASVAAPLAGVAVSRGRVYVATDDDQTTHIYGFDAAGKRTADIAITGQPQHVNGIRAMAAEASGMLVGIDVDTSRVLRIDPASGRITTLATIVDLPSCVLAPGAPACEPGLEDHRPHLTGVAAASNGTVLVADSAQGTIWRLRPDAAPEAWSQSVQQASGDGPTSIAIASDGSVVETVGSDLNPSNATAAAVYRVPVAGDGSAGAPVLIAKLARGDQPWGIAASSDGRIFVALHANGKVVVLGADGSELARLGNDDVHWTTGLALGAAGELFATTGTFAPGRVLRISV